MEQSLTVSEQKDVQFYDDTIVAVRIESGGIYVPVRPICDLLGVDWSAQRQRIMRDAVLSEVAMSVGVTTTDIAAGSRRGWTNAAGGDASKATPSWPMAMQGGIMPPGSSGGGGRGLWPVLPLLTFILPPSWS